LIGQINMCIETQFIDDAIYGDFENKNGEFT
jgi:hypothetical protein